MKKLIKDQGIKPGKIDTYLKRKQKPSFQQIEIRKELIKIKNLIKKAGGTNLRSVSVIDVYQGKGIDESLKSITFRIFWQATGATLEDKEVDQFVENLVNHAAQMFKAKLRS